jgi:hypothetical protein
MSIRTKGKKVLNQNSSGDEDILIEGGGHLGTVFNTLERHGIAVLLLLLGGYVVTTSIVSPLVETSQSFVGSIREGNEFLQKELMRSDAENLSKWDASFQLHSEKRDLILKIDDRLDDVLLEMRRISERVHGLEDKVESGLAIVRDRYLASGKRLPTPQSTLRD